MGVKSDVDMVMGGLMEVVKGERVMTWIGILRWTIIEREMVDRTEESKEVVCSIVQLVCVKETLI